MSLISSCGLIPKFTVACQIQQNSVPARPVAQWMYHDHILTSSSLVLTSVQILSPTWPSSATSSPVQPFTGDTNSQCTSHSDIIEEGIFIHGSLFCLIISFCLSLLSYQIVCVLFFPYKILDFIKFSKVFCSTHRVWHRPQCIIITLILNIFKISQTHCLTIFSPKPYM